MKKLFNQSGTIMLELLITSALLALAVPAVYGLFIAGTSGDVGQQRRVEAAKHLREMTEATRIVREQGWNQFANNGTYHPVLTGSDWSLVAGEEIIGDFTRRMIITDVYRDGQGAIVETGGSVDLSTKQVEYIVEWSNPLPQEIVVITYYTRYIGSVSYSNTSQTDFDTGTFSNTASKDEIDGEVSLNVGQTTGTYESPILDAGDSSAFSYLTINASTPADTTITAQVAVADPVSGSCTNAVFSYVGPDGTDATYFDPSGSIPFDGDSSGFENPAQCFRYKIFFDVDNVAWPDPGALPFQPELRAVTITYSP